MSAKTSNARREAFFAAVRETGNQTLACERAKVSRSWVSLHRASDPAFRATLDAAIAEAKARLRTADGVGPGAGWRAQGGEELAVRGTNGRRVQIARARLRQWTPRVEERFLHHLARCCNVKASCRVVGLSVVSAYGHRERWPDFARRWDRALELGCLVLEGALIDAAGRCLDPGRADHGAPLDVPIAGMTAADAIQLLRLQGKRYSCRRGRVGGPPKVATAEAVRAKISAGIARIERVRAARGEAAITEFAVPAAAGPAPAVSVEPPAAPGPRLRPM